MAKEGVTELATASLSLKGKNAQMQTMAACGGQWKAKTPTKKKATAHLIMMNGGTKERIIKGIGGSKLTLRPCSRSGSKNHPTGMTLSRTNSGLDMRRRGNNSRPCRKQTHFTMLLTQLLRWSRVLIVWMQR